MADLRVSAIPSESMLLVQHQLGVYANSELIGTELVNPWSSGPMP